MFKHNLITAWRNLTKNKFYTGINIAGLSIGLAIGILMLLWVHDEQSYDQFHEHADNIYRVASHVKTGEGFSVWNNSPSPLSILSRNIPSVKQSLRITNGSGNFAFFNYGTKQFTEAQQAYVDSNFFRFFDFKLISGSKENPFPHLNSVVLSESMARKFFGAENPLGKIIVAENRENLRVDGIMVDFPSNSSIHLDMVYPIALYGEKFTAAGGNGEWKTIDQDLGNFMYAVYLELQPGVSSDSVARSLTKIYLSKRDPSYNNGAFFTLRPLLQLHLSNADGSNEARQTVNIFLFVAILLLLIACINYVNLSTARSLNRSREVSLRKIIGAERSQLFFQFILETCLLFSVVIIISLVLIYLLLPYINSFAGKQLDFNLNDWQSWKIILFCIGGCVGASSVYPALMLSSFKPMESLKGKFKVGIANAIFRKALVIIQFSFSVMLIMGTLVISKQLQFIRSTALGFDKSQVMAVSMTDNLLRHIEAVKADLRKHPAIQSVATGNQDIVTIENETGDTDWDGRPANMNFLIHPMNIDESFIPLMKLELKEGKNFSGDSLDAARYILNETAIKATGIKNPIGKRFSLWGKEGRIVGIVKDFHFASLKEKIAPQIFYKGWGPQPGILYLRTSGRDASTTISTLEEIWKRYSSGYPMNYWFLDETYDALYKSDQKSGELFTVFASIALFISCLGLLGLATYTAEVRTKEIGIRKVLGASVISIVRALNKEFLFLVLISILISSPIAWLAMNRWLESFAYSIQLSLVIPIYAALVALSVALLTVSYQSVKAAVANPVDNLRTE